MGDCQSKNKVSDVSEPTIESTKTSDKEPSKEPAKNQVIEPSKDHVNELAKQSTKEPEKEPKNEPIQESVKQPVELPTKKPTKQPERVLENQSEKEPKTKTAKEPIKQPIVNPPEELILESTEESQKQIKVDQTEQVKNIENQSTQAAVSTRENGNQTEQVTDSFEDLPIRPKNARSYGQNIKFYYIIYIHNIYFSADKREIISIHIGQAGVQIGNSCWELFCLGLLAFLIILKSAIF